jgi:hypothetical protein
MPAGWPGTPQPSALSTVCITIIDTSILTNYTNNAYLFDTYTPYGGTGGTGGTGGGSNNTTTASSGSGSGGGSGSGSGGVYSGMHVSQ